jgi:hypothetical protein
MPDEPTLLITCVRAAGVLHFATLILACFTPIPPDWDANLAKLPPVHRRFAVSQNAFIGAVIAFCGFICLLFARDLVSGSPLARVVCAGIALWWGGRLAVLPWIRVWPHLGTRVLRIGFVVLLAECAIYTAAFGWLAART